MSGQPPAPPDRGDPASRSSPFEDTPRGLGSTLAHSWRHFADWHRQLIGVTVLASLGAAAEVGLIVVIAGLADIATRRGSNDATTLFNSEHALSATQLVAVGAGMLIFWVTTELVAANAQARLISNYDAAQRFRLVKAFTASSWESQSTARRGEVVDLLATHLNQSRAGAAAFTAVFVSGVGIVALQIGAILTGGWGALLIMGILGSLGLVMIPLGRWVRRSANAVAESTPPMADSLTETIDLAREIKSFDVATGSVQRVGERVVPLKTAWRHLLLAQRAGPVITQGLLLLVVLAGLGAIVISRTTGAGSYLATVLLLYRASQYGRQLHGAIQGLQVAGPFEARLDEEIRWMSDQLEPSGSLPVPLSGSLCFDAVTFAHPGRSPVLEAASFAVFQGEILGLCGRSGAGKSTVIDLVLRLLRPTSGQILMDGIPVEDTSLSAWRQRVALVPQEGALLDASVADNVRFFRDVSDDAVRSALHEAHVLEEVERLPTGIDYRVGERGSRLSGGQRQRICIARALVGSPELLVLDEPTSALDDHSERAVRATIENLRGTVTVIIAAHRSQTLAMCDRVLEIVDGTVRTRRDSHCT